MCIFAPPLHTAALTNIPSGRRSNCTTLPWTPHPNRQSPCSPKPHSRQREPNPSWYGSNTNINHPCSPVLLTDKNEEPQHRWPCTRSPRRTLPLPPATQLSHHIITSTNTPGRSSLFGMRCGLSNGWGPSERTLRVRLPVQGPWALRTMQTQWGCTNARKLQGDANEQ